jgi:hypothetical protein
MRETFLSRTLTKTWRQMARYKNDRIRHGLHLNLLILKLLLIVASVFLTIAGGLYLVCLFLPDATMYRNAIAMNFLDYLFCIGAAFLSGTALSVLAEVFLLFSRRGSPGSGEAADMDTGKEEGEQKEEGM